MVVNLVAGFQILGTLMSVGLMMLPAASARFWARNLPQTLATAMGIGALSSVIGLVWSYYASLPAGPAIVLSASVIFRLDPVWNARRHLRLRAPLSAICKEKV